ncbi:MAG: hypothetical protein PF484_08420 [Bacteroidales bacterium]|jgi:hypothetical protein|nr:hypothetical protein [Bacteroidales bacterium]
MKTQTIFRFSLLLLSIVFFQTACSDSKTNTSAKKVEIVKNNNQYQMLVDGDPFFAKGGGLEFGKMEALKAHGGNSFRTWRFNNGKQSGLDVLNKADSLGMMVVMGLEVAKERHGFDYDDETAVDEQKQRLLAEVRLMKDHPALLAYGLGNELNLRYTNKKVWNAVNDLALAIKEIDSNHPVTTMLAGAGKSEITDIMERSPDLDFLSFQIYGDILNLPRYIKESGYEGPYFITEWGATGHWEVAQTSWGRPIEQNSYDKANSYLARYQKVIEKNSNKCIGSFVFLWGQKQERTPTWYGLFLDSGEETPSVDAMHYAWNGEWPKNRTPQLNKFLLDNKTAFQSIMLEAGKSYNASVDAFDWENDSIYFHWEILKEVEDHLQSDGGDYEPNPEKLFSLDTGGAENSIDIVSPTTPGEYRLFVYVRDGHNHSAYANIPFLVK